jgi:thymidine kinase
MWQLVQIVDELKIQVICYGLRSDFKTKLFPPITVLMAVADKIEEMKTVCWCGRKTIVNARTVDGKITKTGPQIQVGDSEYHSICRIHWKLGMAHNPEHKET